MSKTKLILIACFCAAFAAGIAAGLALRRTLAGPPRPPMLEERLHLSEQQREQMRRIWSDAMGAPGQQRERIEAFRRERDDALVKLLNEEQKAKYEEVTKELAGRIAALEAERRQAVEEAVESTKKILDESQRKVYERLLKEHERRRSYGPRNRPAGPGGDMLFRPGAPQPGGPSSREPQMEGPPPEGDLPGGPPPGEPGF